MSVLGILLLRIFQHSDWIRGLTLRVSVFISNVGKCRSEKCWIRTLFTRCVYQRNLLMRNLHLTCNLGAPHIAFSCSKSTIKTKRQSHQIPHIVVVFPLSKNHSVYSFRYCIVILWLVTRKVRSWVKLTLTTKKYYDNSNHNDDYFWNADYKLAVSFSARAFHLGVINYTLGWKILLNG